MPASCLLFNLKGFGNCKPSRSGRAGGVGAGRLKSRRVFPHFSDFFPTVDLDPT